MRGRNQNVTRRRESRDGDCIGSGRIVDRRTRESAESGRPCIASKARGDVSQNESDRSVDRSGAYKVWTGKTEGQQGQGRGSQQEQEDIAKTPAPRLFHRRRAKQSHGAERLHRVRTLPQQVEHQRHGDRQRPV